MKNRLQTILETIKFILMEDKAAELRKYNWAVIGDEQAAIADVVLRGHTSPEVGEKAERLERMGLNRVGWIERGSPIRNKAAGLIKARRARLAPENDNKLTGNT